MKTEVDRRVLIYYCRTCGFGALAQQISDASAREFGNTLGIRVDCKSSYWGCFRGEMEGVEIFNRRKTRGWLGRVGFGRTPTKEEIIKLIRLHLNYAKN